MDTERGYEDKFEVNRKDGEQAKPGTQYFVLDIGTDPYALQAAINYAVITGNDKLLADLKKLENPVPKEEQPINPPQTREQILAEDKEPEDVDEIE